MRKYSQHLKNCISDSQGGREWESRHRRDHAGAEWAAAEQRGISVVEDSGRAAAAGRTQFLLADGWPGDRAAEVNTKRQRNGFVLRKSCKYGGNYSIILS